MKLKGIASVNPVLRFKARTDDVILKKSFIASHKLYSYINMFIQNTAIEAVSPAEPHFFVVRVTQRETPRY